VGVLARRARRAEHRHRAANVGKRVKAVGELAGDVVHALGVGGSNLRGLELLVEGRLLRVFAGLVRHEPSLESAV
jgi:hypothetical protein